MAPAAECESRIVFFCSRRCSEPLESAREAQEVEFGGLNNLLQFCSGDYPATLRHDSGPKQCRPPFSISGASRADSSISGHLLEQENLMRGSDSAVGVRIHASFRPLHRVAAGSLRAIYRSDI